MAFSNFNDDDIRSQFLDFLRSHDCFPEDNSFIIIDGYIHRYRLKGDSPRQKSGAYCIYNDSFPIGWVRDWHNATTIHWHYNSSGLSQDQQSYFASPEFKAKAEAQKIQREKELLERQNKAADNARIRIDAMPNASEDHNYLKSKNIPPYGVKLDGQNLAVPLMDIHGNIKSLQWIDPNGNKRFFPDAPLEGLFWSIGIDTLNQNSQDTILLGEGFATMAKVYELTGIPSVAGFSCYYLKAIARELKNAYPKCKIIVTADNDKATELKRDFNPGLDHARELVKLGLAADVVFPEFLKPEDGSDWDDFALRFGNESTADMLNSKISWAVLSENEKKQAANRKKLEGLSHSLDPSVNLPPQEFIGGLFPRKFVSLLIAPPGTGKTIFMQKFVSDLSIGGSIFDGFAEDEPPRKSLILAGEAGYELLIRRGASMKWPVNPKMVTVIDQYEAEIKNIPIMLDDPEGWNNILTLVDIHNPDIIFIDTLSSFHEKDENKAAEMKPMIKKMSALARDCNIAVVPVHHSRKRLAKERSLSLNQDDVIGSSIINRLVGLIVGIEPMKDDEKLLLVRPLKSWFSTFMPFTYTLKPGFYGGTVVKTDLAPASVSNSKIAVWNYLRSNFLPDEWFSRSQIILTEIEGNVTEWQLKRILTEFVKTGKLQKRGATKFSEYSFTKNYSSED